MSFLRPVRMQKVGIVGLKDDRAQIVSVLHDLGVVQVEPVRKEALDVFGPEHGSEKARRVGDQLIRFRGLKAALPAGPVPAPRMFRSLEEVFVAAETVPIDAEVGALGRERDQLLTERKAVEDNLALLDRFDFYPDRLEYLYAERLLSFFGETDSTTFGELEREIPGLSDAEFLVHRMGRTVRFLVAVRREHADAVSRLAQRKGVRLVTAPRLVGSVGEATASLEARRSQIDARLQEIGSRRAAIAAEWYPIVAALEEAFTIENRKLEVWTRLGASERAFTLEGWVPEAERPRLEAALLSVTGGRAYLYPLPTDEEPPTMMANPRGIRRYEFFIRFYSLPIASEWDPTWVFAIAFPVFFGLMLSDIGYGLVILGFSLWMIAGFPGRQHLPRSIKGFVTLIMPPSAMRSLAYTLVPASVIAIGLGFVFNDFFGAQLLPYRAPFDPLRSVSKLLLVAGSIGLVMVVLGFLLGAVNEFRHHHRLGGLAKVGGVLFTIGIATFGLSLIYKVGFGPVVAAAYILLGLGIPLLIAGERAQGVMALIEIISHVLSYTRLVGILLASVILAFVVDSIAVAQFHSGLVGVVAGTVILVVGQLFNIIITAFEPGIQAARLLFVEHFSKFYTGNGRAFRPLQSTRQHTLSPRSPTSVP